MKLFVSRAIPGMLRTLGTSTYTEHMGVLQIPSGMYSLKLVNELGVQWAADNGAYSNFNREQFIKMLKKYQGTPNCVFIAAPDVPRQAVPTMTRFRLWEPVIHHYGYPVALCAQDGLESLPIEWDKFEALFIGGTVEWKMGEMAAALVREARQRGKWVHMGKVNTPYRINYARVIGCDSIDGTNASKFLNAAMKRMLPALQNHQAPLWKELRCA